MRAPSLLIVLLAGCSALVREQASDVARLLDDARAGGAKRCAPKALAVAASNAAFADIELEQGDGERADAHLAIARRSAREAIAAYEAALRLNPSDRGLLENLAIAREMAAARR